MSPDTFTQQVKPFSNYDPTKYRDAHLRGAVFLTFAFSFVLGVATVGAGLLMFGLDHWRAIGAAAVFAGLLPWFPLAVVWLMGIIRHLPAAYSPENRPEASMKTPARAAPAPATLRVEQPPRPRILPAPTDDDDDAPGYGERSDRFAFLPAPTVTPALPARVIDQTGKEMDDMPVLNQIDPRTGRADVPAADVDFFVAESKAGGRVGSPSFRKWRDSGLAFPSGKGFTRTYWEKVCSVAVTWGVLYQADREASRIIDSDVA